MRSIFVFKVAILLAVGFTSFGSAQLPRESEQKAAASHITETKLRADIRFLADDLLEGRGPGTRGDKLAQRYIVSQFESLGLKPAAPGGKWTQEVPFCLLYTSDAADE